jgi:hypothetical protein
MQGCCQSDDKSICLTFYTIKHLSVLKALEDGGMKNWKRLTDSSFCSPPLRISTSCNTVRATFSIGRSAQFPLSTVRFCSDPSALCTASANHIKLCCTHASSLTAWTQASVYLSELLGCIEANSRRLGMAVPD